VTLVGHHWEYRTSTPCCSDGCFIKIRVTARFCYPHGDITAVININFDFCAFHSLPSSTLWILWFCICGTLGPIRNLLNHRFHYYPPCSSCSEPLPGHYPYQVLARPLPCPPGATTRPTCARSHYRSHCPVPARATTCPVACTSSNARGSMAWPSALPTPLGLFCRFCTCCTSCLSSFRL